MNMTSETETQPSAPTLNHDPITDEPGSHPFGSGLGAAAGGAAGVVAAGAVIGSFLGPVSTAVGAVVGGLAGGLIGKGIAEQVNPSVEHVPDALERTDTNQPSTTRRSIADTREAATSASSADALSHVDATTSAKPMPHVQPTYEAIEMRAYHIFISGLGGSQDDNWFRAERELKGN